MIAARHRRWRRRVAVAPTTLFLLLAAAAVLAAATATFHRWRSAPSAPIHVWLSAGHPWWLASFLCLTVATTYEAFVGWCFGSPSSPAKSGAASARYDASFWRAGAVVLSPIAFAGYASALLAATGAAVLSLLQDTRCRLGLSRRTAEDCRQFAVVRPLQDWLADNVLLLGFAVAAVALLLRLLPYPALKVPRVSGLTSVPEGWAGIVSKALNSSADGTISLDSSQVRIAPLPQPNALLWQPKRSKTSAILVLTQSALMLPDPQLQALLSWEFVRLARGETHRATNWVRSFSPFWWVVRALRMLGVCLCWTVVGLPLGILLLLMARLLRFAIVVVAAACFRRADVASDAASAALRVTETSLRQALGTLSAARPSATSGLCAVLWFRPNVLVFPAQRLRLHRRLITDQSPTGRVERVLARRSRLLEPT